MAAANPFNFCDQSIQAGKAILIQNGIQKLLTKDVLIETIEKFSPKWAQPDLTCVTPIIPQKNIVTSKLEELERSKEMRKINNACLFDS